MPRALIVALVERGQHDGLIKRDLGADAIARVLIAIFQGFVLQKCWGEDFDVEACMNCSIREDCSRQPIYRGTIYIKEWQVFAGL